MAPKVEGVSAPLPTRRRIPGCSRALVRMKPFVMTPDLSSREEAIVMANFEEKGRPPNWF